ncbi:helix-turn-helix domain-containing protein [Streptomyces sp. V4-01]|uniref:Helix-turn-helix domain-containing protein n=1 Tax=Actinacidiphila polyblastidii TaxID=3110430 RepID=A0ABU7P4A1_9ACTN|nr:helix-turn-helix domain-containing protein [Streptomyces sp. V4-01]
MTPSEASGSDHWVPDTPRRSDARRNHERVVAAAVEIFREYGTQASVPQIAARAQVGKATVYRSFPTKEDLLETVTGLSLARLEERTASALREADPYEAFRRYVLGLFEGLAHDRLLAERLADATSSAAVSVLETLVTLMETARVAGRLREDVTQMDLRVVLCGTALQLVRLAERDPVTWHRYGDMVLAALRR